MARHLSLIAPEANSTHPASNQSQAAPLDEFKALGFRFCHWVVDVSSGAVSHISREFETVFQTAASVMNSDPLGYLGHILPEDLESAKATLSAGHEGGLDIEFRIRDGKDVRWIWLRSFPLENEDLFSEERILYVAEDVTCRKKRDSA